MAGTLAKIGRAFVSAARSESQVCVQAGAASSTQHRNCKLVFEILGCEL